MKKIFFNLIIFLNINIALASDITDFSPSYLPDKQFSYGAITVGEKLSSFTKVANTRRTYIDRNSIKYQLGVGPSFGCSDILEKSEEYKKYEIVRTKLTSSEGYQILNKKKQLIKYELGNHKGHVVTFDDIVVEYIIQKEYDYVPDLNLMLKKLTKIFGEPSFGKPTEEMMKNNPDSMGLLFVEDNEINDPKFDHSNSFFKFALLGNVQSFLGYLYPKYATEPLKKNKYIVANGMISLVKVGRSRNNIIFHSFDMKKTKELSIEFFNQCMNDGKSEFMELTKREEDHNKNEGLDFSF